MPPEFSVLVAKLDISSLLLFVATDAKRPSNEKKKINNINITEIFDFKLVPKKLIRYTTTNTIADTCIDKAR
jgi:HJR/Mrr/RecB family endonuclease